VPANSPLKRNAQIQLATNPRRGRSQRRRDQDPEGRASSQAPKDIEATMALGNIERGRKKLHHCAVTYSKGIEAMPATAEKNAWVTYYYRGICEERSKQWSKAEADMRKALELQPEQPHVLNYLGYSWIDQGVNLDEGMKMIKRAVDQRPDDGYIVDSLAGPITASATTRMRSSTSSAPSISSRKIRPSTTISAMPTGASAARWKPNSSGRMPATSSPSRKSCRRSRPRSRTVCLKTRRRLPRPKRKKKTARAADRRLACRGWWKRVEPRST
jgi:tetratricopeptide (TPR) repeat protein